MQARLAELEKEIAELRTQNKILLYCRDALDTAGDAIGVAISSRTCLHVNPAFTKMTGYTADELNRAGGPRVLFTNPVVADIVMAHLGEAGAVFGGIDILHREGRVVRIEARADALRNSQGEVVGIIGKCAYPQETSAADPSLAHDDQHIRTVFETIPDPVMLVRVPNGICVDVNQGFVQLTGIERERVVGQDFCQLSIWDAFPHCEKLLHDTVQNGRIENLALELRLPLDHVISTLLSANALTLNGEQHILITIKDISELEKVYRETETLEVQLQQAQKMEAVGTLAGGIAHDFNNLLMGIQGNTSLMLLNLPADFPHYEKLKKIETYIQKGVNLTRQLLGFARGGKYEVLPTDINELLRTSSDMFGRTKKEISLHTTYQENAWTVALDRSQIEQVLLNLYVNAWQAMPDGGDLYIQSENVNLEKGYVDAYQIRPGRYVKISITDTGTGMDKITQQRVFDPFFTTKDRGRGTGLGLASAYGIIKNHGGIINLYSEIGKGTTFNIYLPAAEEDAPSQAAREDKILKGDETILLVDDERMIRDVGQQLLQTLGYSVLVAASGKEALAIYKKENHKIDLILLDMIMPDMGGAETFEQLKRNDPGIRVILSSGYSMNDEATAILARGCDGFIQKPFNIEQLSKKIREVLNRENRPNPPSNLIAFKADSSEN
jgi:PAS domain S-box-containing protein